MWDSQTLQCMKTLEGHEDNVRVLAVGDQQVFSGSWDKTIRVWDLDTLECSKVTLVALCCLVLTARICERCPLDAVLTGGWQLRCSFTHVSYRFTSCDRIEASKCFCRCLRVI